MRYLQLFAELRVQPGFFFFLSDFLIFVVAGSILGLYLCKLYVQNQNENPEGISSPDFDIMPEMNIIPE